MWSLRLVVFRLERGRFSYLTVLFFYLLGARNFNFFFLLWLSLLLFSFFCLGIVSTEFRSRLFLLDSRVLNSCWRFSLSDWRLHSPFSLKTLDYLLKGESRLLNVHLKLKRKLIGNFHFLFKSIFGVLSEILNIVCWIDINPSNFIFFVSIFLI